MRKGNRISGQEGKICAHVAFFFLFIILYMLRKKSSCLQIKGFLYASSHKHNLPSFILKMVKCQKATRIFGACFYWDDYVNIAIGGEKSKKKKKAAKQKNKCMAGDI